MAVECVVFDFGGVLVDWNPRYLYRKIFNGDEALVSHFLKEIDFERMNARVDRGERLSLVTQEYARLYPTRAREILAYDDRYPETFAGPLEDTVAILKALLDRQIPLYGLTNWGGDTFQRMRSDFPFFEWFRGIVVSGDEGVSKPEARIYEILIERYGLTAPKTLFIDDRLENIEAAAKQGFLGHHFQGPDGLRTALTQRDLL